MPPLKTLKTQSMKSVRSNRSMKSMHSLQDSENIFDFDDMFRNGCAKFNCPRTVVMKDFKLDEFLRSMKQPLSTRRVSRKNITPSSNKSSYPEEYEIKTAASVIDVNTIVVTAIYNTMNKSCEILLHNQRLVPRVLMQILGLVVPFFSHLTKISIKNCNIDGYTIFEMTKFLPLTTITEICLDGSPLKESNYSILLEKPCRLTSLSLCRCKICDVDCNRILSKLHFLEPAEATLTVLNLSSNCITDEGAKSIGEALRTNRHLRYLNLADNRISDDGADHIFHALIDFTMTYDEMVCKRQRCFDFLKVRQEIYIKYIQAWDTKSLEDLTSTHKKGKSPRVSKTKKFKPNVVRAEMIAKELAGEFIDPFSQCNTKTKDGVSHCFGNMVLCYLNLSFNNLSYISVQKLNSVLLYQSTNKKLGQTGLLKVVIDGNPMPMYCDELDYISDILQKNVIQFSPKYMAEKRKSRVGSMGGKIVEIVSDVQIPETVDRMLGVPK